jgi:hypothetical protein
MSWRRGRTSPLRQPNAGILPSPPPESVVVVSPHFDDAVFSCWTVLVGEGEVDVVTVFTAGPGDARVSDWDSDTGVTSAERMVQRAEENDAALALVGRSGSNLGLLQASYGGGAVPREFLAECLARATCVYAPAGTGFGVSHPEHVVVRDACRAVRPDARLYADNPYSSFSPDAELPDAVGVGFERQVVILSSEQRRLKAEAIRCYAGELSKLERHFGPISDADALIAEVFWIPPSA